MVKLYIFIFAFIVSPSAEKSEKTPLEELYSSFKLGQIVECQLKDEVVYKASINAYDAPVGIYDSKGEKIATCNLAWGQADEMCSELENCKVIYRCERHITGRPFVDRYGLTEKE